MVRNKPEPSLREQEETLKRLQIALAVHSQVDALHYARLMHKVVQSHFERFLASISTPEGVRRLTDGDSLE